MSRRAPRIALIALIPLLAGFLPAPAAAEDCPCAIVLDLDAVAADTFVVKLEVAENDTGNGFVVLDGSRMFVRGTYEPAQQAVSMSFGWTDMGETRTAVALYSERRDAMEVHATALAGSEVGQEVHWNEAQGGFSSASISNTFGSDIAFPASPLYLVLAVPEAAHLDVDLDLRFDRDVRVAETAHSVSGKIMRGAEMEGLAQVTTVPAAVAVDMAFTGVAPEGTRGFAFLGPPVGTWGVMRFGIDAPEDSGVQVTEFVPPGGWSTKLAVAAGPPGAYEHRFDAMLRVQEANLLGAPLPGPHAVFYAAPIPL